MPIQASVRIIGKEIVDAKLLAAAPRILATNRALVTEMLNLVKAEVEAQTPIGPGHFGYHGRDTLRTEVASVSVKTTGKLFGAVQLYWREYGTGMRFRGGSKRQRLRLATKIMTGAITGGEAARMPAHKALSRLRRIIRTYYGASWWNGGR